MNRIKIILLLVLGLTGCNPSNVPESLSEEKKMMIRKNIVANIQMGLEATRTKNIDTYMSLMPDDIKIHNESGEIISKEKQKKYALRNWSIIDTTLQISMDIDSIQYLRADSILVYTSQSWERIMFQRDGITTDTVLTTQRHKETWKKRNGKWYGYEVLELGGTVFINGELYLPDS